MISRDFMLVISFSLILLVQHVASEGNISDRSSEQQTISLF
jgi:hypothetical protein